jgi:hypothetical protein
MAAPNPSPIGQTVYTTNPDVLYFVKDVRLSNGVAVAVLEPAPLGRVAAVGEPDTYPLSALTVSA